MVQNKEHNRSIVLAAHPHGTPVSENFQMMNTPVKGVKSTVNCCWRF